MISEDSFVHSLWKWSQNWLKSFHTFFRVFILFRGWNHHLSMGFTSWPQALLWSHATLGLPGHQDWIGCLLQWPDVLEWMWQDLLSSRNKCHRDSTKKHLSRTWLDKILTLAWTNRAVQEIFKCLFLCQGKPKSGSPLPKSLVLCRMDRVKTSGCFQNSEPSELGCV